MMKATPAMLDKAQILNHLKQTLDLGDVNDEATALANLSQYLEGVDRNTADEMVAQMQSKGITQFPGMNMAMAALFAHERVDPLVLAWLTLVENGSEMLQGSFAIDTRVDHQHHQNMTRATLANDIVLYANGTLSIDKEMPETVVASIDGKPLSTIVSHPYLDLSDITVIEMDDDGFLQVDMSKVPGNDVNATPEMLAALSVSNRR